MSENPNPDVVAGAPAGHLGTDMNALDAAKARLQDEQPVSKPAPVGPLPIGTVAAILAAPSDLVEEVVEVPEWNCSVRIRSLTAAAAAKVRQTAIRVENGAALVQFAAMEKATFLAGVVEPEFQPVQVTQLHQQSGVGFARVLAALEKNSNLDREKIKEAAEAFQTSGGAGPESE